MQAILVLVLVVLALLGTALIAIAGFNRLRRAHQAVAEAWAQVDTQLQRRFDLVGGLNEIVAAATTHERLALTDATTARLSEARDQAERVVTATAVQLVAIAEAYPSLHSSENFQRLHEQLVRTEDDIAASRRYYNGRVRQLNTTRQTFPWAIMASLMSVGAARYFQIELDESQVPVAR